MRGVIAAFFFAVPISASLPDDSGPMIWRVVMYADIPKDYPAEFRNRFCRELRMVEAHLAQCRNCLAACDSLRRSIAVCQAALPGPVPAAVANAVRASVHAALADMRRGAPSAG